MSNQLSKIYQRIDTVRKYKPEQAVDLLKEYEVKYASKDDLIEAKRLHASIYLERKFIEPAHVTDGVMPMKHDPYQAHAIYFVVKAKTKTQEHKKGEIVAVARQIETTKLGLGSLPVIKNTQVKLRDNYHQAFEYVEISALVKKKGINSAVILLLFRAMFQHSDSKGHKIWLMACDEYIYHRMKTLYPYTIHKIGPKAFYMGSYVIPTQVNIKNIQRSLNIAHLVSPPPFRKLRKGLKEIMLINVLADF